MATKYTEHFSTQVTPQTEPIPGKAMVKNSAGGFTFKVSPLKKVERFLILGSEGGSYYATERELTRENANNLVNVLQGPEGLEAVKLIVDVSVNGRAHKNDPAIFALALATTVGNKEVKKAAYDAITQVCRTGTALYTFCGYIQDLRKWSAGLRRGVAAWYENKSADSLAYQALKYRQRNGWTHRDVMRLAHPSLVGQSNEIAKYLVGKDFNVSALPNQLQAFLDVQTGELSDRKLVNLITSAKLPWEALPTEKLNSKAVWEALLPDMGTIAMIRNLNKMTALGMFDSSLSDATKVVINKLENVKADKVHPMTVLLALMAYKQGRGIKGSLTWMPQQAITDGLDKAFYNAFEGVEPTNKNTMLAIDVSGSMTWCSINNTFLTPRDAAAAMALVTAKSEKFHEIMAFSSGRAFSRGLTKAPVAVSDTLDKAIQKINSVPAGGTDCALPMLYALENKIPVDTFCVYTDNETWAGSMQPVQALEKYRQKMGRNAKLVVVGMVANDFTIADPNDAGMLDVVGFDAAAPTVIADFSRE